MRTVAEHENEAISGPGGHCLRAEAERRGMGWGCREE